MRRWPHNGSMPSASGASSAEDPSSLWPRPSFYAALGLGATAIVLTHLLLPDRLDDIGELVIDAVVASYVAGRTMLRELRAQAHETSDAPVHPDRPGDGLMARLGVLVVLMALAATVFGLLYLGPRMFGRATDLTTDAAVALLFALLLVAEWTDENPLASG